MARFSLLESDIGLEVLEGCFALVASIVGVVLAQDFSSRRRPGGRGRRPLTEDGPAEGESSIEARSVAPEAGPRERVGPSTVTIPAVSFGFVLAVVAGLAWGIGNAATRYSAVPFPSAALDIALIHYGFGALSLLALSTFVRSSTGREARAPLRRLATLRTALAAVFKGLNTYSWILAVTLVPAALVATLENLHVLWTLLILGAFTSTRITSTWVANAIVVILGAALITGVPLDRALPHSTLLGLSLSFLSGLAFSIFSVAWARREHKSIPFVWRCRETAMLLFFSAVSLFPIHLLVDRFWLKTGWQPFSILPFRHLVVQAVVGVLSIGLTYLLMNEALMYMSGSGPFASLLLGLGISFAVAFTMIAEVTIFREPTTGYQWIGVVLFSVGFATIRSRLTESSVLRVD
jgi:drug/metabolite transporter (DMT)-like permease